MLEMSVEDTLLSDLVVYRTYAKYIPEQLRRESLTEAIERNMHMHMDRFPLLTDDIYKAFGLVHHGAIMPSMRGLQFGGTAVERNNIRQYNCSFHNIDRVAAFSETLYLLLCGTGVGYSVQRHHVNQLPKVSKPLEFMYYVIHDSIEGWGMALNALMEAYLLRKPAPQFDFFQIRDEGVLLKTTGGRAPGPAKLKKMLELVQSKLDVAVGRKLKPIEVHDIQCMVADCVRAGGIREAALIALFDRDDTEMLRSKTGEWWIDHPYRGRANNSAILPRDEVTYDEFKHIYGILKASGSGEPGFYWTNNKFGWGANPCFTGDAKLLTSNGYETMQSLWEAGGRLSYDQVNNDPKLRLSIVNRNGIVPATQVYKTSDGADIWEVELQTGQTIRATSNHTFIMQDGSRKQLKDLLVNESLPLANIPNGTQIGEYHDPEYALLAGWVIGDGSVSRVGHSHRAYIRMWNTDIKDVGQTLNAARIVLNHKHSLSSKQSMNIEPPSGSPQKGFNYVRATMQSMVLGRMLASDGILPYGHKHKVPNSIWGGDKDTISAFLKGLFSADGSVQCNESKGSISIRLWQTSEALLKDIQILLSQLNIKSTVLQRTKGYKQLMNDGRGGVKSYHKKIAYELIINGLKNCKQFMVNVGFIQSRKNTTALDWFNIHPGSNNSDVKMGSKIISISHVGFEPTYCLTEPGSNEVIVNGVVVGQCVEIALRHMQFCNLSTVNQATITSVSDLMQRVKAASFLGTLQASYTDFPFLDSKWREITEMEALIGVSYTGIADVGGKLSSTDLHAAAEAVVRQNQQTASLIGINPAARTTTGKPEGSSSAALATSSGLHARKGSADRTYLRRVRLKDGTPLVSFLMDNVPGLMEKSERDDNMIIAIPQKAPDGAIMYHTETAMDTFNRAMQYNVNWVAPGHISGDNRNNMSCTIDVRDNEWDVVMPHMWENRNLYNGLSLFPYDGGTYVQAPFEPCDRATYDKYLAMVKPLDFTKIVETADTTEQQSQSACAGGACEIT